jgi:hypothetical protein
MENLTFIKTVFHGGDIRRSEAGPFVRLHFTSEFTQAILDQAGWDDPGESSKKTRLDNPSSLPGGSLVLTPDADTLKKHEVSLSFSGAKDFDLVTVSDGDYRCREFRFTADSVAPEAAQVMRDFWAIMGEGTSFLKLTYTAQDNLPV